MKKDHKGDEEKCLDERGNLKYGLGLQVPLAKALASIIAEGGRKTNEGSAWRKCS